MADFHKNTADWKLVAVVPQRPRDQILQIDRLDPRRADGALCPHHRQRQSRVCGKGTRKGRHGKSQNPNLGFLVLPSYHSGSVWGYFSWRHMSAGYTRAEPCDTECQVEPSYLTGVFRVSVVLLTLIPDVINLAALQYTRLTHLIFV